MRTPHQAGVGGLKQTVESNFKAGSKHGSLFNTFAVADLIGPHLVTFSSSDRKWKWWSSKRILGHARQLDDCILSRLFHLWLLLVKAKKIEDCDQQTRKAATKACKEARAAEGDDKPQDEKMRMKACVWASESMWQAMCGCVPPYPSRAL